MNTDKLIKLIKEAASNRFHGYKKMLGEQAYQPSTESGRQAQAVYQRNAGPTGPQSRQTSAPQTTAAPRPSNSPAIAAARSRLAGQYTSARPLDSDSDPQTGPGPRNTELARQQAAATRDAAQTASSFGPRPSPAASPGATPAPSSTLNRDNGPDPWAGKSLGSAQQATGVSPVRPNIGRPSIDGGRSGVAVRSTPPSDPRENAERAARERDQGTEAEAGGVNPSSPSTRFGSDAARDRGSQIGPPKAEPVNPAPAAQAPPAAGSGTPNSGSAAAPKPQRERPAPSSGGSFAGQPAWAQKAFNPDTGG